MSTDNQPQILARWEKCPVCGRMNKILVGTTLPMGVAAIDVCMDCGCLYAIGVYRGEARVEVQKSPPPGFKPGPMPPMSRG